VVVDWVPTTLIMTRVAAGEQADVLVVIKASMDELVAQGKADPTTRVEVAHSRLGLAVAAGAPHPVIGSIEAFKAALSQARSVACSRAGASGIHLETVIDRLGITDAVRSRATVIPAGFTAEKLVTGERANAAYLASGSIRRPDRSAPHRRGIPPRRQRCARLAGCPQAALAAARAMSFSSSVQTFRSRFSCGLISLTGPPPSTGGRRVEVRAASECHG